MVKDHIVVVTRGWGTGGDGGKVEMEEGTGAISGNGKRLDLRW